MGGSGGDQETRMDWEERRVTVWDCGALGAVEKERLREGEEKQKRERKKKVKKKRVYNKLTV